MVSRRCSGVIVYERLRLCNIKLANEPSRLKDWCEAAMGFHAVMLPVVGGFSNGCCPLWRRIVIKMAWIRPRVVPVPIPNQPIAQAELRHFFGRRISC